MNGDKIMPLTDDIGEFSRNITRAVDKLEEARGISSKLNECTVEGMYEQLTQLQDLCEQASVEIKRAGKQLIEVNTRWGSEPLQSYSRQLSQKSSSNITPSSLNLSALDTLEINLKSVEDGNFFKLIQSVLESKNSSLAFPNMNQAKGALGESLCHIVQDKLFSDIYFLEGKVGLSIETSTEQLAYKAAKEFLDRHPQYKTVVASRPFEGGQPYSLDAVNMLISRNDVENWLYNNKSTAIYFVFESKTDTARLSKSQKQFDYVKRQAMYMFKNRNKIEDRSQLGKDILTALEKNRVFYVTSHVDLKSGKLKAKFIR
ncbi:hypothetical protein IQ249_11720 [Lusitaniella coriacea LEGE 07157]|uniref:Uncharacterized protein n=1 Tax=Lusitaniella coriacea LEGE 07157 TaxID=945747 RepID=A0A8J7DY48_9CYAN|nr:hypothetical protein [Lusitaniella coriacea]MBE9116568.1 hypothetical protein [Lusitaniella coriacea LEGE 07157]